MRSNCEVYCGFNFISGSGSEGLAIFEFFFFKFFVFKCVLLLLLWILFQFALNRGKIIIIFEKYSWLFVQSRFCRYRIARFEFACMRSYCDVYCGFNFI